MATVQQRLDALAEQAKKAQDDLSAVTQENARLKTLAERYSDENITDSDKALLKAIAQSENGLRHHQISEMTGTPTQIARFQLAKLGRRNFIAVHGGGNDPLYYKLDEPGAMYLLANNLI